MIAYEKSDDADTRFYGKYPECDGYVCCFSVDRDSLPMWNYYSKGTHYEGYNIGFQSSDIRGLNGRIFGRGAFIEFTPIMYSKTEQLKYVRDFINDIMKFYTSDPIKEIQFTISDMLAKWSLVFKHESFSYEKEVRLIVYLPKKPLDNTYLSSPFAVKYRFRNGMIIPYIEFALDKEALQEVNISPLVCSKEDQKIQANIMQEALRSHGYHSSVHNSEVPIRY